MADVSKDALKKVERLLAVFKEGHDRNTALLEEITELLGGGVGIAAHLRAFEVAFDVLWCERYAKGQTNRYVWRFAVDRPNIKRLLKTIGLEELKSRAFNYLRSDDAFLVRSRHPFGLLVHGINGYANEGDAPELHLEAPTVADCRHLPRCASDQQHTRLKAQEMRQ